MLGIEVSRVLMDSMEALKDALTLLGFLLVVACLLSMLLLVWIFGESGD